MSGSDPKLDGFAGRARLLGFVDRIRESYWFLPGSMSLTAVFLAIGAGPLDRAVDPLLPDWLGLGRSIDPDSARAILTVAAGSTVGVAGVAFSILVAAMAFASGQFGPRVVGNLMRDRVNQTVLGVFLATFLFCLLSLRLVGLERTPTLTIVVSVLLAVASVGALIHFFHHAPETIRLSSIVATSGRALISLIERRFPLPEETDIDTDPEAGAGADAGRPRETDGWEGHDGDPVPLVPARDGYLRIIDFDGLMSLAARHDIVIRIDRMPGDFIAAGRPLAWLSPRSRVRDECIRAALGKFDIGEGRSPAQDANMLAQQLCDIAARALSTGINDPRTAMSCLDWIGAALSRAARGRQRPSTLRDVDGRARIALRPHTVAQLAAFTLGTLRPYFERDPNAALHMMATIGTLVLDADEPEYRALFLDHARQLGAGGETALAHAHDRALLAERLAVVERIARPGTDRAEAMAANRWL